MIRSNRFLPAAIALACLCAWAPPPPAYAQVPAAGPPAAAPAERAYSPAELEKLVGPFALYPDDLVAIIVPASTYPLQIVQADRFLEKRKGNKDLKVDDGWDDSVKSLVNYPEVIKKMSADLDWTEALGEAVASDTSAVMAAVQAFRRKAQGAGSLKSDDKQVVIIEQEVIKIEPADPQVVYVPQYVPSQVVVAGSPYYYPYSAPYPAYWYPYAPGAALAAGVIWGAAIGAVWSGGRYASHYGGGNNNITINRGNNNINTGNINTGNVNRGGGNRAGQQPAGSSNWKASSRPQGTSGANRSASRPGDAAGGAAGGNRASTRPSPSAQGGAFGGFDSGAAASRDSARGQQSRGSAGPSAQPRASTGGGARASGGFSGGGGARASGGGGGARGGGGGGRGGGGRR